MLYNIIYKIWFIFLRLLIIVIKINFNIKIFNLKEVIINFFLFWDKIVVTKFMYYYRLLE